MAAVGRPPKPTALKLIQGNPGKRPINKNEPQPEIQVPEPPDHLDTAARAEWARLARELFELKLISNIDRAAFAAYCQAYSRWVDAEQRLAKTGLLVKTPTGYPIQSPYIAIANKCLEQMHKFLTEFGMTPASRSRIGVGQNKKPGNPFDDL